MEQRKSLKRPLKYTLQGMNNPGNTNSGILKVLGQNGLLINSDKLERGARRILLSGDII